METITWIKFECGGGARWTSPRYEGRLAIFTERAEGKICNFSGCNCGTIVKIMGTTTGRTEASTWFKRPTP